MNHIFPSPAVNLAVKPGDSRQRIRGRRFRLVPLNATGEQAASLVRQTSPGVVLGTVAYMSPEPARVRRPPVRPRVSQAPAIDSYDLSKRRTITGGAAPSGKTSPRS